jgi:putative ABC transport system substrate-binding protein
VDLKRLQLLVEAAPGVSRVAVLGPTPDFSAGSPWGTAARSLGVELIGLPDPSRVGFEAAFEHARASGAEALLTRTGGATTSNLRLIGSLAERYRLAGVSFSRDFVAGGGLMAYVARQSDMERRAADYVDRILRGTRPADLPVELPTRYDLVVNRGAARALGLTLSRDFFAGIDEVIE